MNSKPLNIAVQLKMRFPNPIKIASLTQRLDNLKFNQALEEAEGGLDREAAEAIFRTVPVRVITNRFGWNHVLDKSDEYLLLVRKDAKVIIRLTPDQDGYNSMFLSGYSGEHWITSIKRELGFKEDETVTYNVLYTNTTYWNQSPDVYRLIAHSDAYNNFLEELDKLPLGKLPYVLLANANEPLTIALKYWLKHQNSKDLIERLKSIRQGVDDLINLNFK